VQREIDCIAFDFLAGGVNEDLVAFDGVVELKMIELVRWMSVAEA
jgi:hypothetical protein